MSISGDYGNEMAARNDMEARLSAVEAILNYEFRNRKLLEDALTHSSYPTSPSYERLEFLGDAVLGLAFAQFLYSEYPMAGEGLLTLLRSQNVGNAKLARVALRHGLFRYVRHYEAALDLQVQEFALAVQEEDESKVSGDTVDVLADIVESVVGAVYMDCDFDVKVVWQVIWGLLEPIITLEALVRRDKSVVNHMGVICKMNEMNEIEEARQKLHELCHKKKWPKPVYGIEEVEEPAHSRKYVCSVTVDTDVKLSMVGDAKSSKNDAKNSAVSFLIQSFVLSMCEATSVCPPGIFILLSDPFIWLI